MHNDLITFSIRPKSISAKFMEVWGIYLLIPSPGKATEMGLDYKYICLKFLGVFQRNFKMKYLIKSFVI